MAWSEAAGKPGAASSIPIKVGKESVFQYWTGDMTNLTFHHKQRLECALLAY